MKRSLLILAFVMFAFPAVASATNYVVHVHGRTQSLWDDTMYSITGYTSVKCNYEAKYNTLAQSNATVRSCLATYCSGANSCIAVGYSNGMNQIMYTQNYYPSSVANLLYVEAGGDAEGGSELITVADTVQHFLDWFGISFEIYYPSGVDATLSVSGARNAYNHNATNGRTTYQIVGDTSAANGLWYLTAGTLPGDDDGVVSWASAYACSSWPGSGSYNYDLNYNCTKYSGHVTDTWCTSDGWFGSTDHFSMDERGSWCY